MSESKPTLHREQIAGMNIHYIMWSLDYFLDVQQRLGFESIELWCAEPHVTLDHTGYFEAEVLAKKAADRGLRYRTLCPENVVYPWQYCARKPLHEQRSLAFLKTHTDTLMVLDAKEYGMEAVPASVRAYLDPVLFYAMNCELRAARGKVFDHDPDFRRYMGVVEY